MLHLICPTCGELLGTKEIPYEEAKDKICKKYNIDQEMISQGVLDTNEKISAERAEIINKLCKNMCCKMRLISYVDLSTLIV